MKSNKILKVLGVVLTLATLTSMFLFASPVSAATTPQAWNEIALPSTTGNVLASFNDLGPIAQAKDASAIYMGASNGSYNPAGGYTTSATNGGLYKSTDFGRTWTLVAAFPNDSNYTGQIFDITCSSQDASTVYVTDGRNIYKTVNAGTSWTTIAGLFSNTKIYATPAGSNGLWITSLSVGYLAGNPEIFVSVSGFDSLNNGGAYVCNENSYSSPWSDLNIGSDRPLTTGPVLTTALDVSRITVLPDFATSQDVMAVWTDYTNGMTRVSTKYGGNQWDTTANGVDVEYTTLTTLDNSSVPLLDASIFIPSDFSSNPNTGLMQAYIGINSMDTGANGISDVYLAYFGPATSLLNPGFDLNIAGTDTSTHISGMSGMGTAAAADIMVSGFAPGAPAVTSVPVVYTTKNGSAGPWVKASKAPTGGASPLYSNFALSSVLLKADFATSGQALVATQGTNAVVSFTQDFGVTFNSISMIDTTITGITTMALTSDNTIYAITTGAASNIWRYTAATSTWELVNSSALYAVPPVFTKIVALSDNSAVFAADSNGYIYRSVNNGQTWQVQLTLNPGGPMDSILAVNANTVLVGDLATGLIYATNTNGVVWFTRAAFAAGDVSDIRVASNGDYLAADINAGVASVAKSTDGGLTWTAFLSTLATTGASAVYITPATDYATSGNVYLTSAGSSANRGVYFATATTPVATGWTRADSAFATFPSGVQTFELRSGTGIVATAGGPGATSEGTGMIYATDTALAGLLRIKGSATVAEGLSAPVNTITGLWLGANTVGNVSLYTIGSDNNIYTYIDTLNKAGSGVTVSAITTSSATISWTALPNATAYWVVLTPSTSTAITSVYATPAQLSAAGADGGVVYTNSVTVTGLDSTTTYAVSVWAAGVGNTTTSAFEPISSFMFSGTFTTNPAVPTYPDSELVPNAGATNVPLLVNFQWDAVTGATSYELMIDTNLDMSTAKDYTGIAAPAGNSAGDFSLPATDKLAYNTLYYWEVRAVTATGHSTWSGIWSFTTAMAPQAVVTVLPAPTPTIIITAPAQVTVTQAAAVPTPIYTLPEPNITIQQASTSTPTYIWIIVGVGALLTLAVIVLIIRTRRVV